MYWSGPRAPAAGVGLRTGSSVEYRLVDAEEERTIGTVDDARVFSVAHPGAVYLHQGQQYRVDRLDTQHHIAVLEAYDEHDEYTMPRTETDIAIVADEQSERVGASVVHLGAVEVSSHVIAYQRKQISTNRVIEVCDLDLPERSLVTRACWYTVPAEAVENAGIAPGRLLGTVHAAEHGLIGMLPLFTICDRWDVGGVSMAMHPQTGEPTIFVYDGYPGGAGDRRAGVRGRVAPRARDPRSRGGVPLRRGVPVVRAVAEVRQLERVSRQGRRDHAARAHGSGNGARLTSVASTTARACPWARPSTINHFRDGVPARAGHQARVVVGRGRPRRVRRGRRRVAERQRVGGSQCSGIGGRVGPGCEPGRTADSCNAEAQHHRQPDAREHQHADVAPLRHFRLAQIRRPAIRER